MSMSEEDADVTASAFDPLAAMQALEAAGINRNHAEAIAAQLRAVANADPDPLSTSTDLDLFRGQLESFRREVRYGLGIVTALDLTIAGRLFGIL